MSLESPSLLPLELILFTQIEVLQLNMANVLLEKGIDLNAEDEEEYANITRKYMKIS